VSTIEEFAESILMVHLIPLFGTKRLDEIIAEQVQRLTQHLKDRAPKRRRSSDRAEEGR